MTLLYHKLVSQLRYCPKFPTAQAHYSVLSTILEDLFARVIRLPFAVSAPTGRGVAESLTPPTPLFTLHFLIWYAHHLRSAWSFVQAHPHRLLTDDPATVPLAEVTEIDADVLIGALRDQEHWVKAAGFPLARAMRGHAPTEVQSMKSPQRNPGPVRKHLLPCPVPAP